MRFESIFLVLQTTFAAVASVKAGALTSVKTGALTDSPPTFSSLDELTSSYWWDNFLQSNDNEATVRLLQDRSVVVLEKKMSKRPWYKLFRNPVVEMKEISLGDSSLELGVDFFPLATGSAEFSLSDVKIEYEFSNSFAISLSLQLRAAYSVVAIGLTNGLGSTHTLSISFAHSIACKAPPGGKVQLQVRSDVVHYPQAKSRTLTFSNGIINYGSWEFLTAEVDGDVFKGALFYKDPSLENVRCVTDENLFSDPAGTSWVLL